MLKKSILLLCLLSLSITACNDDKKTAIVSSSDKISYKLGVELDLNQIAEDRQALAADINSGKKVSFKEITALFNKDHAIEYSRLSGVSIEDITAMDADLELLTEKTRKLHALDKKKAYEILLENNGKSEITYNSDAVTLYHLMNENRMQCFSGTSLYLSITRASVAGSDYRKKNYVTIVKPGHVLPGVMLKTEVGYRLVGIETTGLGDAVIDFGLAKDLSEALRIIDAEMYVIAKVFESALAGEAGENFLNAALTAAAKKYGHDLVRLEALVKEEMNKQKIVTDGYVIKGGAAGVSNLNQSLFAFTSAVLPAGELSRHEVGQSTSSLKETLLKEKKARAAEKRHLQAEKNKNKKIKGKRVKKGQIRSEEGYEYQTQYDSPDVEIVNENLHISLYMNPNYAYNRNAEYSINNKDFVIWHGLVAVNGKKKQIPLEIDFVNGGEGYFIISGKINMSSDTKCESYEKCYRKDSQTISLLIEFQLRQNHSIAYVTVRENDEKQKAEDRRFEANMIVNGTHSMQQYFFSRMMR